MVKDPRRSIFVKRVETKKSTKINLTSLRLERLNIIDYFLPSYSNISVSKVLMIKVEGH